MSLFDLPLDQLRTYRPDRDEPADFDDFWAATLQESPALPVIAARPQESWMRLVDVTDVTFAGYRSEPIRAWLLRPRAPQPTAARIIHLMGYNRGRGFPHQWLALVASGHPVLVVDNRGQGAEGVSPGSTPDNRVGSGPDVPGFITRGIDDPRTSYLRRLYVDATRAVDAAIELVPEAATTIVAGGSLGGGTGLAVCGLRDDVDLAFLDVPSLAHNRRATQISNVGSRHEIARYLTTNRGSVEQVFGTLSYFDGVNLAARAGARAWFSVGLMDQICPPSTVFAAFNHYSGVKDIDVWEYNGHEGGGGEQLELTLRRIAENVG